MPSDLKTTLKAELAKPEYAAMSVDQKYAALFTPKTKTTTTLAPLTAAQFFSIIQNSTSFGKLMGFAHLPRVLEMIDNQDRPNVALWINALAKQALITSAEATAMNAELTKTMAVTTTNGPLYAELIAGIPGAPNTLTLAEFQGLIA